MLIDLKKYCKNKTITRNDGLKISKAISDAWDFEEQIIIDFSNILVASVSFFDEAFGKLAFRHPKETLRRKLDFRNIKKYDRALVNDILISRYRQKELDQNGFSNH